MKLKFTKKQWRLIACWAALGVIGAVVNTMRMSPISRQQLHQSPFYSSYARQRAIMLNPLFLAPWMLLVGLILVWSLRPFSSQEEESQKLWGLALALFSLLGLAFTSVFKFRALGHVHVRTSKNLTSEEVSYIRLTQWAAECQAS